MGNSTCLLLVLPGQCPWGVTPTSQKDTSREPYDQQPPPAISERRLLDLPWGPPHPYSDPGPAGKSLWLLTIGSPIRPPCVGRWRWVPRAPEEKLTWEQSHPGQNEGSQHP